MLKLISPCMIDMDKDVRKMIMVHDFLKDIPLRERIGMHWALLQEAHQVALSSNPKIREELLRSTRDACKTLLRDVFHEDL